MGGGIGGGIARKPVVGGILGKRPLGGIKMGGALGGGISGLGGAKPGGLNFKRPVMKGLSL
jgi:hypothetical protein